MSLPQDLLELERRFWLDSVEFCRSNASADARIEYLPPIGRLTVDQAIERLSKGPHYVDVSFADVSASEKDGQAMLCYRAAGWADSATPYVAYCSSTYARDGDRWRLLAHRQEPADLH